VRWDIRRYPLDRFEAFAKKIACQLREPCDQAGEENSKQTFDLTAKEAKFAKKEKVSEGFLRFVPN